MPYFPYLFLDDRFQNFFRHCCSPRDHDPHALFLRPRPMRPGSQWIRSRWGAGEIPASPISKTTCRRKVLYVQRSKHFGALLLTKRRKCSSHVGPASCKRKFERNYNRNRGKSSQSSNANYATATNRCDPKSTLSPCRDHPTGISRNFPSSQLFFANSRSEASRPRMEK